MPPTSTQNLNAKLSLAPTGRPRSGGSGHGFTKPAIQRSASPVQIVGVPARYRGGYHLSF
jgi:hypothetical protein